MKKGIPRAVLSEREQQIYQWKVLGKGISWARWCAMNGIKAHLRCPARPKGKK